MCIIQSFMRMKRARQFPTNRAALRLTRVSCLSGDIRPIWPINAECLGAATYCLLARCQPSPPPLRRCEKEIWHVWRQYSKGMPFFNISSLHNWCVWAQRWTSVNSLHTTTLLIPYLGRLVVAGRVLPAIAPSSNCAVLKTAASCSSLRPTGRPIPAFPSP